MTTIYTKTDALDDIVSDIETRLEVIIDTLKNVQKEAQIDVKLAHDLRDEMVSAGDQASAKALIRRAENLYDLATKMVLMTR